MIWRVWVTLMWLSLQMQGISRSWRQCNQGCSWHAWSYWCKSMITYPSIWSLCMLFVTGNTGYTQLSMLNIMFRLILFLLFCCHHSLFWRVKEPLSCFVNPYWMARQFWYFPMIYDQWFNTMKNYWCQLA